MTPKTLWHASRADIAKPTIANRTVGDNHANSGLGLFCATAPDAYIANFGPYVFALELNAHVRVHTLRIEDFAALSRDRQRDRNWFEAQGREWAQQYDVVLIQEIDGRTAQAIIVSDAAIARVTRYDAPAFLSGPAKVPAVATPRPRR
jgi:hypothetical protein